MSAMMTSTDANRSEPAVGVAEPREVTSISIDLSRGGMDFCRSVTPAEGVDVKEVMQAIRDDANFFDPLVAEGTIEVRRGRKRVVLADYVLEGEALFDEPGEITAATIYYDDDTGEQLTLDQ